MKLGLSLGYWSGGAPQGREKLIALAESLGYESVWTAESYGSDALTPLAWWGSRTTAMRLGTSVIQMSARTPAATAMAAMSLDQLSAGRFVLGLGVSGPQVVEGWYGQPYPKPLARTREYVAVLREIFAREKAEFDGEHYALPYRGGTGLGKALRTNLHPQRPDIPILLAAEGPKNVALAAEIADGWMPVFYSPDDDAHYRTALAEGFARPGARRTPDDFEVAGMMSVVINDDLEAAADQLRPTFGLYIGGMGAKSANFHADVFRRMGFEEQVERIQALYLDGRHRDAAAAVTLPMIEKVALVGPRAKVADDYQAWKDSLFTTLLIGGSPDTLRAMAEIVL